MRDTWSLRMCWYLQEGQKEVAFKGTGVDLYRPSPTIVELRHLKGRVVLDKGGDEEAGLEVM